MLSRTINSQLRGLGRGQRPLALYTAGCLTGQTYTTVAEAILRHAPGRVAAVVDHSTRAPTLAQLDPWAWAGPVPVVAHPSQLPATGHGAGPRADLVVGISLPGTERIRHRHRQELTEAAEAGHRVFNALHDTIDHPRVVNLRQPTPDLRLAPIDDEPKAIRIAVIGTTPDAGMLGATVTLTEALDQAGWSANWVPTSDAGVLLHGFGRCLDATPAAYAVTILQDLIHTVETEAEVVVVEGVGTVVDPTHAGLAATVAHATRSHYHILCHRPVRSEGGDGPRVGGAEVASALTTAANAYHHLHTTAPTPTATGTGGGRPSTLAAVAVDTGGLSDLDRRRSLDSARVLGVPVVDWRHHPAPMVDTLALLAGEARP